MDTFFTQIQGSLFLSKDEKQRLIQFCKEHPEKTEQVKNILEKGERAVDQYEGTYTSGVYASFETYQKQLLTEDIARNQSKQKDMRQKHSIQDHEKSNVEEILEKL